MAQIYGKVALIGLGLIASSMAHAMRRGGVAAEISGYARSQATRDTARRIQLCDTVCDSAEAAVEGADLIVLAVPVGAMGVVAEAIAPHLKPGATVIDVGSVKAAVVEAVGPHVPDGVHFVPTHPMAGTEHSGPEAGFASLFDNRWTLIVPPDGADRAAVERVEAYWQALGANCERMEVTHHDLVCAVVSHIPHLIAYTMVGGFLAVSLTDFVQGLIMVVALVVMPLVVGLSSRKAMTFRQNTVMKRVICSDTL
ncbi:prephenate dehydrogenase/arogenate dehydrogenase family protein [Marinovum algicola]|uniref:prephenate dehydrogenase/arogenate dehydrogenase family protein n=1 Tax=Marinovum algicola TaxID=42444 RepID=UPI0024B8BE33|nr:prephenate dehydrogenase/arogenate dehydrogenase family protein [Marinovum algicola]